MAEPTNTGMQSKVRGTYAVMETDREPYLNRARVCSALTIPTLILPAGFTGSTPLPTPYQSLGARGVNNLTSKLLFVVLPPNQPFFEYRISNNVREQLGRSLGETEQALAKMVREIMMDIETTGVRPSYALAIKHLLIAGNVLTFDNPDGPPRVFPMDTYVVRRFPDGSPRLVIVKECISTDAIPPEMLDEINATPEEALKATEKTVDLYTVVEWSKGRASTFQEIRGVRVPGSEGHWPADICPWNPQQIIPVQGQDYGRSYVEEYIGDLQSLETLTRALVRGAVAASKIVGLVNPNGVTDEQDVADAEGGDIITGSVEDVGFLQLAKQSDFQFAETRIQKLTEGLSYAFLLNSAVQRQAERVTAQEIRYVAQELESQLGGIYTYLSVTVQMPLAKSREAKLKRAGRLPSLPKGVVELAITTGVEAIGRGNDMDRLNQWVQFMAQNFGPDEVAKRTNITEAGKRAAHALGIDDEGLMYSEEDIAAQQQAQQEAAMEQAAVGPMVNQVGQMAQAQMAQQPPA